MAPPEGLQGMKTALALVWLVSPLSGPGAGQPPPRPVSSAAYKLLKGISLA